MLILIGEGRVQLVYVNGEGMRVQVKEDRLVIHVGKEYLMKLLPGCRLWSPNCLVCPLRHPVLQVTIVQVRSQRELFIIGFLEEVECPLTE